MYKILFTLKSCLKKKKKKTERICCYKVLHNRNIWLASKHLTLGHGLPKTGNAELNCPSFKFHIKSNLEKQDFFFGGGGGSSVISKHLT